MFELVMSVLLILLVVMAIIIQNRMLERIRSDIKELNNRMASAEMKISVNSLRLRSLNLDLEAHKAMSKHGEVNEDAEIDKDAETANQ